MDNHILGTYLIMIFTAFAVFIFIWDAVRKSFYHNSDLKENGEMIPDLTPYIEPSNESQEPVKTQAASQPVILPEKEIILPEDETIPADADLQYNSSPLTADNGAAIRLEPEQSAPQPPGSQPVRHNIKVPNQSHPGFHSLYEKKLETFFENLDRIAIERVPVIGTDKKGVFTEFYHHCSDPDMLLEELYLLWQYGYQAEEIGPYIIHYFYSIHSPVRDDVYNTIVNSPVLSPVDQDLLEIVYGGKSSEIPEDIRVYINQTPEFMNLQISMKVHDSSEPFTRRELEYYRQMYQNLYNITFKTEMYRVLSEGIAREATTILKFSLLKKYPEAMHKAMKDIILHQVFFHGKYKKMELLKFIPPEIRFVISGSALYADQFHYEEFDRYVQKYPFAPLHSFYFRLLHSKGNFTYIIDKKVIHYCIHNLDKEFGDKNFIPLNIRFILFRYYIHLQQWNNIRYLYSYLGEMGKSFLPRLFHARAFFQQGDYHQAVEELLRIQGKKTRSLIYLNELAVYYTHAGMESEAEEVFDQLREEFPENHDLVHNESYFLKMKAKRLKLKKEALEQELH